jgi:hypothetical protein
MSLWLQYWAVSYAAASWLPRLNWHIVQVIMIARLHAMYQQSRKVLIFLSVIFLAINFANGVIAAMVTSRVSSGKL